MSAHNIETEVTEHIFEKALGAGPYRYVGYSFLYQNAAGQWGSQGVAHGRMGSCEHCFTGIRHHYWVRNGAGQVFAIGSDCIEKMNLPPAIKSKVKTEAAKARKAQLLARKLKSFELWALVAEARKAELAAEPHPNEHHAARGKTLADYVGWCIKNQYGQKELRKILGKPTAISA